jgi:hypothetical protein
VLAQEQFWQVVEEQVHIRQKVVHFTPTQKLLDAFLLILSGGEGLVELNRRVRPDAALQHALGRAGCAEQSTVSRTLEACTAENVAQLRSACEQLHRRYGQIFTHPYRQQRLWVDVDVSGQRCGRQAQGATRGYFAHHRRARGRQLGRVYARAYDEIIYEQLYPGNVQLPHVQQELIGQAQRVLGWGEAERAQVVLRLDAAGSAEPQLNWILEQGYRVLTKITHYRRCAKLAASVETWFADPTRTDRQLGWVGVPYAYARSTRQLAVRYADGQGKDHLQVLIASPDLGLGEEQLAPQALAGASVQAYDQRGGGVETAFKNSHQGLGLNKRHKGQFSAQEMLILLAQLAYNLLSWVRRCLQAGTPALDHWGPKRLIRDILHIPGKASCTPQGAQTITLAAGYPWVVVLATVFRPRLAKYNIHLILRKI